MSNAPCAIRETAMGTYRSALEDEALAWREIELTGAIDRAVAMDAIRALRFLAKEDGEAPVTLLINSPGGSVVDGLAVYDTMQALPCPVRTICVGEACSMASILLAGGAKGHRALLPNSSVMIHDPLIAGSGVTGSALTVEAMTSRLMQMRRQVAGVLARHTGHTVEEVLERTARDTYYTAEEAVRWGLADKVLTAWEG